MSDIAGIYVITDRELHPGRGHVDVARAAVRSGASVVQLRDKTATDREFYRWAEDIRDLTWQAGAIFVINDRIHIAAAVEADGVNVGQSDLPVRAVRKVLHEEAFIGVSCSNLKEARAAEADGADYIGFGPIYTTTTKADTPPDTGLDMLRRVVQAVSIPVVAIGGINLENAPDVIRTGAHSICVVSAVVCAQDMDEAVAELVQLYTDLN